MQQEVRRNNSNFMALILIGIGAIWLLGQANILGGASFAILARVWPVILIALGVNILIARNNPQLSLLVGAATVIMVIALMVVGPALGWVNTPEVQQQSLSQPLDSAERAEVRLDLSVGDATVSANSDSNNLIDADVTFLGDLSLEITGSPDARVVHLYNEGNSGISFNFPFWGDNNATQNLRWDVRLTDAIPLDLQINGGVGDGNLDLSALQLTDLGINTGVGDVDVTLPSGRYAVNIAGGVGNTDIRVEDGAALDMTISGVVGSTTIDLPEGVAVRVNVSGGLGGVDMPAGFEHVSGEREQGVWETTGYNEASADERITIVYSGGVGGLTLR
jgi:hypothetical protein